MSFVVAPFHDGEASVDDLSLRDGHVIVVHLLVSHLAVDVEGVRGFPQHQLHLGQSSPPDAGVPRLQLRNPLVQEVNQVSGDGQQHRLGGNLRGEKFNDYDCNACICLSNFMPLF